MCWKSARVLVLACVLVVSAAASLSAGPLTTVNDFLLYTEGNLMLGQGTQMNGPVGAMGNVTTNGGVTVTGDVVSGGNVTLANGVDVLGTVTNPGTFTQAASATAGAHVTATPAFPSLPSASSITTGTTGYTGLGNGFNVTLAPGQYNAIQGGGSGEIHLTGGTYTFSSITTGNGLDLYLDLLGGPISILVAGNVNFGAGLDIHLLNGGAADVYLEAQGSSGQFAFIAGGGSEWLGTVYTPNSGIHFGSGGSPSTLEGHFWSKGYLDIEHSVTGNMGQGDPQVPVPEPATLVLTGTALSALALRRRRSRGNP